MSFNSEDVPDLLRQIEKLKKINSSLIARHERPPSGEPDAFALFENAATVDWQVRHQTEDLRQALRVLKHSNDTLNQAKQMAEAANALKTTFLASVSHDLLQPLHAARLALSVLNEGIVAEPGKTLLGRADQSLSTLEDIIRTLLDLSKLDAGVSKPMIRNVAIDGLIDDLFAEFMPVAKNQGLVLRRRGSCPHLRTDPLLLRRILQNLLSNAIRYTRRGGVLLCCTEQAADLRIDIADTGPGIQQNRRAAIFEEFQRDDPGVGGEPGFGLGLAIVRRLALAMGHEIKLWSRPGVGSVFSILLPRAEDGSLLAEARESQPAPPFEGVQIIFIARDKAAFKDVFAQLANWGCEAAFSSSHSEASYYLQSAERTPDLLMVACERGKTTEGVSLIAALRTEADSDIAALLFYAEPDGPPLAEGVSVLQLPVKPAELYALMAHRLQVLS